MFRWWNECAASVIEASFKQVGDGYVFRYNQWLLGWGPVAYYRVTEAQKAAISERLLAVQTVVWQICLAYCVPAFVAFFGGTIWLATNRYSIFFLIPLGVVSFGPLPLLTQTYRSRRLTPLIAALPRSDEQITYREVLDKFAGRAPLAYIVAMTALSAAFLVHQVADLLAAIGEDRPAASITAHALIVAAAALLASYFAYLAIVAIASRRHSPR